MPKPPCSTGRQHVQMQFCSMGKKSEAKEACRRLSVPVAVTALPKRWDAH